MVLSNLSVSDVSIYFVWLRALLVVRDELEHLWRAISCGRLNRSPQVSHLNGSFARSATVILLLTVPHCGIRLLCRFKSCGRLNFCPYRSQDICKASLSTAVILRLFVICSIVVVIISSAARLPALTFSNPSGCSVIHTYIHTYIPIPIRCSPLLSDTEVTSSSELTYLRRAPVHWHDAKCWIVVSIIPHGTNSEKPPLYLLPTSAATSHRLANTTDDHR